MPTVIDELFVRIGLDASQFDKENAKVMAGWKKGKESAKDSLGGIEQSAKKTADYLATLKTEVIGLFLAFAGARSITGFVMDTIHATAEVGRLSGVLGVNINTLNAWGDAFKSVGGDVGDAARVFGNITGKIAEWRLNPGSFDVATMGRLGFKDIKGFEDPEETLLKLADTFQARKAEAEKSNDPKGALIAAEAEFRQLAKQGFGLTDNDISLIEQGRSAIRKQVEAFKEQDRVTQADAKAAQDFNTALIHLQKSFEGLLRSKGAIALIENVTDALTKAATALNGGTVNPTDGYEGKAGHWEDTPHMWGLWHTKRWVPDAPGAQAPPANTATGNVDDTHASRHDRAYWRNRIAQEADRQGLTAEERAAVLAYAEHESHFDPDIDGPVIQRGAHKGDRPHGLFQYMAKSSQGWDRHNRTQQIEHGVAEFKRNARAHGINGAFAIVMSGNPKAGQPGGPNPSDGYITTSQFIAQARAMMGKYSGFVTTPAAQAAEAPKRAPERPAKAEPTHQATRTVRFAVNPPPQPHRARTAAQRAIAQADTRAALEVAAKAHGYNVHSARQQQAVHNTTSHVTQTTHVNVTVQGDAKNPHKTGEAIAGSVHHHLQRHRMAIHANTGLN